MKSETTSWLLLGGLLCLLVVVCIAADNISKLDASIASLFLREQHQMQTITQEVTRTSGSKVTVSTTRLEGESLVDWIKRHDDAVALLKTS